MLCTLNSLKFVLFLSVNVVYWNVKRSDVYTKIINLDPVPHDRKNPGSGKTETQASALMFSTIPVRISVAVPGYLSRTPDHDFIHPGSRIPDPGSNNSIKRGGGKICSIFSFFSQKYHKSILILFLNRYRKNWANSKNLALRSQKYGLGYGIRKKHVPVPGSRGKKKAPYPVSGSATLLYTACARRRTSKLNHPRCLCRREYYAGCESPITDEVQLSEYLSDYSAWESSSLNLSADRMDESGSVASQVCFSIIVAMSEYLSDYSAWESSSLNLSADRMDESGSVASQVCFSIIVAMSEYLSDYSAWESSSLSLSADRMDESGSVASQVCYSIIVAMSEYMSQLLGLGVQQSQPVRWQDGWEQQCCLSGMLFNYCGNIRVPVRLLHLGVQQSQPVRWQDGWERQCCLSGMQFNYCGNVRVPVRLLRLGVQQSQPVRGQV